MRIGKIRSVLYKLAKVLGDGNAVKRGNVGKRIGRRVTGKAVGREVLGSCLSR